VSIDYCEKSNEELLFTYGFVVEDNPEDMLMLYAPLPLETQCVRSRGEPIPNPSPPARARGGGPAVSSFPWPALAVFDGGCEQPRAT